MIPSNGIKLILAFLLLLCLLKLPYGLYTLLRVIFTIGFVILATRANEAKKESEMFIYISLAILFQPLLKIPLGRTVWNIVDVIIALGLVIDILKPFTKSSK